MVNDVYFIIMYYGILCTLYTLRANLNIILFVIFNIPICFLTFILFSSVVRIIDF